MNSIKRSYSKTLRLGAMVSVLAATAAHGGEMTGSLVMTAYSNSAGANSILSEQYEAAIREIGSSAQYPELDAGAISTNLCVAQTMAGNFIEARKPCTAAVNEANSNKFVMDWDPTSRQRNNRYTALAYANRAVLHWLAKDFIKAEADMASARRHAPKADFVSRNLSAMMTSGAMDAQVRVTAAK